MRIEPLDLSDDDVLHRACAIERSANGQVRPGWQGLSAETRVAGWRAHDGWAKALFGTWSGDALTGFGISMTADEEPDTTWAFAWTHPEFQRRGIGTALMREAETRFSSSPRMVSRAYRTTLEELRGLERRFLSPLGHAMATTETVVELDLRSATLAEPPLAAGYSLITCVNGVPEHLREQVGRIKGLVDAEAPHGDLGWMESPVSAAEYAAEIGRWVAQGSMVVESLALDADGRVAAWTCLVTSSTADRPAQVEGTLVLTAHRGRGLGAAVKLASLSALKRLGSARSVRTSSDQDNTWMRAINTRIGFTPVESEAIFQKPAVSPRSSTIDA